MQKIKVFVLSKKYYASKEEVIEFIVLDNKEISARLEITLKKPDVFKEEFILGEEYEIDFKEVLDGRP